MSFKKLNTQIYQKAGAGLTPDNIYWKKLGAPVFVKEFGLIDYVDFSPVEPYHFAVTCSVRVQVYNPITKTVVKNLSRFRENAYGAVFRSDGRLLCAGGEEAVVKLFDVSTKGLLRLFKGHTAAVHRTQFVNDRPHIASFSDDKSIKIWDIPTEKNIISYTEHTDYIRAGITTPVLPDIILSGGYDNIVKMYDTRTQKPVLEVNHGSPIESLVFMPSGGMFLSAGGTEIKIWDSLAGGRLLGCLSQHHKTITCLRLASDNKRLLSGSLDRHVKVYDVSTFKVVHTLDYPNAILSLGVSKTDDTLVAGLSDGLVAVCRREEEKEKKPEKKKISSFRYESELAFQPSVDLVVPAKKHEKETKYDLALRKFEYSKALDAVLIPYVMHKTPQVTVSVLHELIRRRGLQSAFEGREPKSLIQILKFFIGNIADSRFTEVLIDAANIFLSVYANSVAEMPAEVKTLFVNFSQLLDEECQLLDDLNQLEGSMNMLLSVAALGQQQSVEPTVPLNLVPSKAAQEMMVVELN